jgi:hypothetical protein
MKNATREECKGWTLDRDTGEVIEVTGYFCENPADPDRETPYWWCPAYGYSIPESSLHASHLPAAEEALAFALLQKAQAEGRIERYGSLVRALGGSVALREQQDTNGDPS